MPPSAVLSLWIFVGEKTSLEKNKKGKCKQGKSWRGEHWPAPAETSLIECCKEGLCFICKSFCVSIFFYHGVFTVHIQYCMRTYHCCVSCMKLVRTQPSSSLIPYALFCVVLIIWMPESSLCYLSCILLRVIRLPWCFTIQQIKLSGIPPLRLCLPFHSWKSRENMRVHSLSA